MPAPRMMITAAGLVVSFLLPAAPFPAAHAHARAENFSWSLRPAGQHRDYFGYALSPGQQVKDKVAVTNQGTVPLTLRIYATDAFNTADGSFALLTADKQPTGLGTWVSLRARTVTVKPGKHVDVPFTLKVPGTATPGDHSGGVIAAITEQRATKGGRRVNVDRRVAARVYLRVNGPLTSTLRVDRLSARHAGNPLGYGTTHVTYRVRNTGNVRLAGQARIRAEGLFGWTQGRPVRREIPELLPGSDYTLTERIGGVPPTGPLTVSLRLTPSDPGAVSPAAPATVTRTTSVWVVPWAALTVLALLAGVLVLRRRRSHRTITVRPA